METMFRTCYQQIKLHEPLTLPFACTHKQCHKRPFQLQCFRAQKATRARTGLRLDQKSSMRLHLNSNNQPHRDNPIASTTGCMSFKSSWIAAQFNIGYDTRECTSNTWHAIRHESSIASTVKGSDVALKIVSMVTQLFSTLSPNLLHDTAPK